MAVRGDPGNGKGPLTMLTGLLIEITTNLTLETVSEAAKLNGVDARSGEAKVSCPY